MLQARADLQRADSQVADQPQHRNHDAETIDGVAGSAMDAFTKQRVQRGAQSQRLIVAISEVTQRYGDQGIDGPAVQAPMQKGQSHRLACGCRRCGSSLRRIQVMRDGFGGAEIEQGNADAGREQHAGPGAVAESRLLVIRAQLDFSVR